MLAVNCEDRSALKFPLYASPKIDGIRCIVSNGVAWSRKLLPIPNQFIQAWAKKNAEMLEGMDGELISAGTFQDVSSAVTSEDGEPDFKFMVFDLVSDDAMDFTARDLCIEGFMEHQVPRCEVVEQILVGSLETLEVYERRVLAKGYEGVMIRRPDSPYKFGRSTEKECYLLKLKPFEDAEAVVIGFEEEMHNGNEATRDAVGRTKRSTAKAGKVGKGRLGKLLLQRRLQPHRAAAARRGRLAPARPRRLSSVPPLRSPPRRQPAAGGRDLRPAPRHRDDARRRQAGFRGLPGAGRARRHRDPVRHQANLTRMDHDQRMDQPARQYQGFLPARHRD
jgi:DNA ligase-1